MLIEHSSALKPVRAIRTYSIYVDDCAIFVVITDHNLIDPPIYHITRQDNKSVLQRLFMVHNLIFFQI